VPSAFLSGDKGICDEAAALVPGIAAVATSEGFGPATRSLSPARSVEAIREGVAAALNGEIAGGVPEMANDWLLRIEFTNPVEAYKGSWYPGMEHPEPRVLEFRAHDFFDVQRAIRFVVLS
jgi:D-amino peptidase